METNLSLTLQGDFCVSMIGRAALRCSESQKSVIALQWNNEKQTAPGILREKNPEHRDASQHRTSHGTNSFNDKRHTPERWRECGVCLASHPTADLQRGRVRSAAAQRSSPSAAAAVPPGGTEPSPAENAHTLQASLQHSDLQQ